MANVLFKRGLQANLPAQANQSNANVVDGALYFTTDTKRLFLGQGTTMLPIAEGITTVSTVTQLPTSASGHAGEFYYVSEGNILAYSDGSSWLQVNSSSQVASAALAATATNITMTITSNRGDDTQELTTTATMPVFGGSNVTLSASSNGLVISAQDTLYDLATATSTTANAVDIALTETGTATTTDLVTLKGANGVTITRKTDGTIEFGVDTSSVGTLSAFTAGNGNGETGTGSSSIGFYYRLVDTSGFDQKPTIDPQITYGKDANNTVHFQGGVATLSIYTKSEVDTEIVNLKRTLDAMTYMGTASQATDITGAELHNGDTYKATAEFSIGGQTVEPGYLIIVRGSETDGVITGTASYDIVAGDSTDHTYSGSLITHGVSVQGTVEGESIASIALAEGTGIDLSDSGSGAARVVTVSLEAVTVSTSTGTAVSQGAADTVTFNVISSVSTDSFGRVSNIETTTITLAQNTMSSLTASVATASNVATVTYKAVMVDGTEKSDAFSIGTSSGSALAITSSDKAINVDLVWGTFT